MDSAKVSQEQLFAMIDTVNSKKNALSKELASDLINQMSKYKVSGSWYKDNARTLLR